MKYFCLLLWMLLGGTSTNASFCNRDCGGVITDSRGVVVSPGFGGVYRNNLRCCWLIQAENSSNTIVAEIQQLEVEPHTRCAFDYLQIYDGSSTPLDANALSGPICGDTLPSQTTFVSSGDKLMVFFYTDTSTQFGGFQLAFQEAAPSGEIVQVCGGTLDEAPGWFTSPNYPENYYDGISCVWYIEAPEDYTIQITFDEFSLEDYIDCTGNDYVQVFDGSFQNSMGHYCGEPIRPTLTSTGSTLIVSFISNSAISYSGFNASYIFIAPPCGGTIDESGPGWFTSPNYPDNYDDDANCTWYIQAPEDHTIQITLDPFVLEYDYWCLNDRVEVFENFQNSLGSYCGTLGFTPILTSDGASMIVTFTSNNETNEMGFNVSYVFIATPEPCGGTLDETGPGWFTSPNFPSNYYDDANCEWNIQAPEDHKIQITFNEFVLQDHVDCTGNDNIRVYDGSTILGYYCGTPLNLPSFTSSGDTMTVVFSSDFAITYSGFNASYTFLACGGTLDESSPGWFTSPNYPDNYDDDSSCTWYIQAPEDHTIEIVFDEFVLENEVDCVNDYVEVFDGDLQNSMGIFCGTQVSRIRLESEGATMIVSFSSDTVTNKKGFYASYEFIASPPPEPCEGTLDETGPGWFASPNYPDNYDDDTTCTWTIQAPENYTVEISFLDFLLEYSTNCSTLDYVQVFDGDLQNSLGHYCGQRTALSVKGNRQTVIVTFLSNAANTYRGFNATYSFIEAPKSGICGFPLTGTGIIDLEDLNPDGPYCWHITAEAGQSPELVISTLEIPNVLSWEERTSQEYCVYSSIQIYDGANMIEEDLMITKQCDGFEATPQYFKATGQDMIVLFTTSTGTIPPDVQFVADYAFSPANIPGPRNRVYFDTSVCGGTSINPTGTISTPYYPDGNYPNDIRCAWYIDAPEGYSINVTINVFFVEEEGCLADYLQFFDSDRLFENPVTEKLCGFSTPQIPIVADSGTMLIYFETDSDTVYRGWTLDYSFVGPL